MTENIPRIEYPRPQMKRKDISWVNLNGEWDFEFDFGKSGMDREFYKNGDFTKKIIVPFCPESKLSGIEYTDFIPACWYRKKIHIDTSHLKGKILLHFGAVDYKCHIFVNEKEAGNHMGGYSSFNIDITSFATEGENTIVVYAEDDLRLGLQPRGKQSGVYYSQGCDYTRTTGIWQTVWLEFVPENYIKSYKVVPDLNSSAISMSVRLIGDTYNFSVRAEALFAGNPVGDVVSFANGNTVSLRINLNETHIWEIEDPNLYDLKISLLDTENNQIDSVDGYFGLRNIALTDNAIYLNNKPVFQKLVLDQGFYPDGIYTAPTDEALINDINLSQSVGFNGARLHQKAFEERFLYHADRMGYLVWGEHASWGLDITSSEGLACFLPEWLELIERDFNHPSIIGWCPFNETWDTANGAHQDNRVLSIVYSMTKAYDPTRPVIDTSGNYHVVTDIYDVHDYDQNVENFAKKYKQLKKGEIYETYPQRQKYADQPYFISEYGGTWWNPDIAETGNKNSWGYGDAPKNEEEFCERYMGLTSALLNSEGICAFCYTQLYDIEQEQNGLFTYDRKPKFSKETYEKIKKANMQR